MKQKQPERESQHQPGQAELPGLQDDDEALVLDGLQRSELCLPHGRIVYGLAFSRDCTRLATACLDNTIRLWDIATHDGVAELRGHTDYVHAVAFSPDGTRLVSCSGDFTIRLWDTLTSQERAQAPKKGGQ